jgi:cbb3-type cytochrome oxidase cytochrome c subunit
LEEIKEKCSQCNSQLIREDKKSSYWGVL